MSRALDVGATVVVDARVVAVVESDAVFGNEVLAASAGSVIDGAGSDGVAPVAPSSLSHPASATSTAAPTTAATLARPRHTIAPVCPTPPPTIGTAER